MSRGPDDGVVRVAGDALRAVVVMLRAVINGMLRLDGDKLRVVDTSCVMETLRVVDIRSA